MNETVLTVEDAARCLSDLVERVHTNGETAVLVKAGRPLARLVPVPCSEPRTADLIAFLRRWRLDQPEPDVGFGEAIEESRKAVEPPRDPWQ
jgi:prevent-host-death family protein